jgi:3-hydroxybutyryl-CoA dehydrogenase
MKNITVIGSGTMGNGIAHVFAQNNYKVSLVDVNESALKKAVETIGKNLDRQVSKGQLTEADKDMALANLTVYTNIQEGAENLYIINNNNGKKFKIKLEEI